jgi:hypothetical protein
MGTSRGPPLAFPQDPGDATKARHAVRSPLIHHNPHCRGADTQSDAADGEAAVGEAPSGLVPDRAHPLPTPAMQMKTVIAYPPVDVLLIGTTGRHEREP